ncbi:holin [Macrococcoides caseolyticum]|uniref:holin n=1 Tax=Macrococcoides caseolyticum TaxID=69966 RepID=UPI0011A77CDC|nr:holin [Macrococcus caseolyticus]
MEQIIMFAVVLSALVAGLLEVVKSMNLIDNRFLPLAAVVLGAVLGAATEFVPELLNNLSIGARIVAGIISGLMAVGLFENIKQATNITKDGL